MYSGDLMMEKNPREVIKDMSDCTPSVNISSSDEQNQRVTHMLESTQGNVGHWCTCFLGNDASLFTSLL